MYMVSMMTYYFSMRGFGHPVFLKPHFGHPVMKILTKTLIIAFNPSNAKATFIQTQGRKDFGKPS